MDLDVIRNYKTGVFHHLNPQYLSVPNFLNNSFIYSGSLPVIFLFIWPVKCLLLHYLLALFSISACILYRMTYILTFFSLTGLYLTILIHSYFRYRTHLRSRGPHLRRNGGATVEPHLGHARSAGAEQAGTTARHCQPTQAAGQHILGFAALLLKYS